MRLTSEFWVSQLIRRVFKDGGYAAVIKKGAAEAGAIFIKQQFRDGSASLYAPAPQTDYDTGKPQERGFSLVLERVGAEEIEAKLMREMRFDADLWAVEVEVEAMEIGALICVGPHSI
jgi:hypothetical protein